MVITDAHFKLSAPKRNAIRAEMRRGNLEVAERHHGEETQSRSRSVRG